MIKCIIFDMDGLMFNTESASKRAWEHYAKLNNANLDEEFFLGIYGTNINYAKTQFDRYPYVWNELENIQKLKTEYIEELRKDKKFLMPGLIEILDYLKENNYLLCLGSSSSREVINKNLEELGERKNYFDLILSGFDFTNTKPDPEIFLTAAEKLKLKPENCVVLEDSYLGLVATKKANMTSIFVEDQIKYSKVVAEVADYHTKNLYEALEVIKSI